MRLLDSGNSNTLDFRKTAFLQNGKAFIIDGGWGSDTIYGNSENNIIIGAGDADTMDGGDGSDIYRVTGNYASGWSSFQHYDTYADTGVTGTDTIQALGVGDVDIGLKGFGTSSGIEVIDATGASGQVRLLGSDSADVLDFRTTTLKGSNIVLAGGWGADTIYGNGDANTIIGGYDADTMDGGNGSDGGNTTFGSWCSGYGGQGGAVGNSAGSAGGGGGGGTQGTSPARGAASTLSGGAPTQLVTAPTNTQPKIGRAHV